MMSRAAAFGRRAPRVKVFKDTGALLKAVHRNVRRFESRRLKRESFSDMDASYREKILKAVMKRAVGYKSREKVDELVYNEEGGLTLSKRRITEKDVPGDVSAAKLLLETGGGDLSDMTDEQLSAMQKQLLKELKEDASKEK